MNRSLLLFAACSALAMAAPSVSAERANQPAKLTPQERDEVRSLIQAVRKAKEKPADQKASVDRLLAIGGPAVDQLMDALKSDLDRTTKVYAQRFQKQASTAIASKFNKAASAEVKSLREKVLSLPSREDLTSEMIVREADPAMSRLSELFLLEPKFVLQKSKDLSRQRTRIVAWYAAWDRGREALAARSADPADLPPTIEEQLLDIEASAMGLAMPLDAKVRATLTANSQLAAKLDTEEYRTIEATNSIRTLLGLAPLAIDLKLCDAARDHSQDMEKLNFFSHTSSVAGKEQPFTRAQNFGTTASGENIFKGTPDGRHVTDGWFHSPPHQKNLLADHTRVGVGRSGKLFTQMFGR